MDATTAVQNVDDSRTPCRSSPKNKLNISKRVKTNSSKLENPRELLAIDVQQTDHRKNAKDSRRNIKDINQESSSQLEFTIARNGKAVDEKFASSAVTLTKGNSMLLGSKIEKTRALCQNA